MKKLILLLIIVLAFVLRFYRLDSYPALNADEAAIGYNAYSLIQTGKDEHGNSWPIHFQSFNDYKPGLYFYLALPFVKLIGLNEWAVRIPGSSLGVLTVLVIYFLVLELFKSSKNLAFSIQNLALGASFLLAISPWHIHFSRGGWEVNVATFFIALGLLYFVKYTNRASFLCLVLSVLSFVLSLYTYHAARIIVPLLGLGMSVIYRKEVFKNFKLVIFSLFLAIFLLIPLVKDLTGPAGISRAAGVGLFADPGPLNRINEQRGEHADFTSIIPKLFHNKAVNYGLAFWENWVSHYHGEFLFLSGDAIERDKVPETGQMYLFDILFLIIGFVVLLKSSTVNRKSSLLVFWWLTVAPVASALTFQSPHALRAHNMVIPIVIISAVGLSVVFSFFKKFSIWHLAFGILIAWSFLRYQHMYWVHMARDYPYSSQYGLKELVSYVVQNQNRYEKVFITDRYDQPYILFLFYEKYPPAIFQKEQALTSRDKFGFSTVRNFWEYHFEAIDFAKIRQEFPNSLIVRTPEEIPPGTNIMKRIYGTNGYNYFDIVAN